MVKFGHFRRNLTNIPLFLGSEQRFDKGKWGLKRRFMKTAWVAVDQILFPLILQIFHVLSMFLTDQTDVDWVLNRDLNHDTWGLKHE